MSVIQYEVAFLDRLNVCRFVPGMQRSGYKLLVQVGYHKMTTAYRGWHRRRIHFEGRGAAWLRTCGQETDMSFVRMEEKANYEFCLAHMFLLLATFYLG